MLEARDLYCERDDRVLFQHLDFSLCAGQSIQVQGSNGSGKTTLLRILCGLNRDYRGDIRWQGQPVEKARADFRAQVFYLGHAPAINRSLSAAENLRWFCASRGVRAGKIREALAAFNLQGYDDVPCYMMSAGQQRRAALARLLVTEALLWVLDEPFTAIDKQGVAELQSLLVNHAGRGGMVILSTHQDVGIPGMRRLSLAGSGRGS